MSKSTAIVLVHGFWGGAAHWAKVITELSRRGYTSLHAVEMPLTSLADDAGARARSWHSNPARCCWSGTPTAARQEVDLRRYAQSDSAKGDRPCMHRQATFTDKGVEP